MNKFYYLAFFLVIILLAELFLVVPEVWPPGRHFLAAVLPSLVVKQTNEERINQSYLTLKTNPLLEKAAQLKADDMAKRSYFSHQGPNGETPWSWFDQVGYRYIYAGENLALNFYDHQTVTRAWMNSIKHRNNILSGNFTDIGIGIAYGEFAGRPSVFIVQFFGSTAESLALAREISSLIKDPQPVGLLSSMVGLSEPISQVWRKTSLQIFSWFGYLTPVGQID